MIGDPHLYRKCLTSRQFEVLELVYMGYSRKEIAQTLVPATCVQAVHQIVLRIRKRVKQRIRLAAQEQEPQSEYGFIQ